LTTLSD